MNVFIDWFKSSCDSKSVCGGNGSLQPVCARLRAELEEKHKNLGRWESRLFDRQKGLENWSNKLNEKKAELLSREQELERDAKQLEAWRKALQHQAEELEHREDQLSRQEEQLEDKKACALKNAADRYASERAAWETMCQNREHPDPGTVMQQTVQKTGEDFRSLKMMMSDVQNDLRSLLQCVGQQNNGGITELCWLHREMMGYGDEQMQRIAGELSVILQQEFGAEPIDPTPGSFYDSELCERVEGSGSVIVSCDQIGWRWNQEVLRAVVTTEEV